MSKLVEITFFLLAAAPSHAFTWTSFHNGRLPSSQLFLTSVESTSTSDTQQPTRQQWASHALLISSFTDGVVNSPDAKAFLKFGLAKSLAADQCEEKEEQIRESVMFSPCAGPNIDLLNDLEDADSIELNLSTTDDLSDMNENADVALRQMCSSPADADASPRYCRLLYIPTAMYALNPESKNTQGKQRQRARADGKKRRNLVVKEVQDLLGKDFEVLACTVFAFKCACFSFPLFSLPPTPAMDFDDGSIKQPVGSDDTTLFPEDGREALSSWKPHLIYVEGGNTFWLQHCMEKGDWISDLFDACTGPDAFAVYCGKSAGAIVAGSRVDTATWKGWDNPSVVPDRETYDDWVGYKGLSFAGDASMFPHMDDVWEDLVVEKKKGMGEESTVYCLREWEACCIDGEAKKLFIVKGEH